MAYLQTHFWKGGTEEQYQSMLKAVHPPEHLPDGQKAHVAGPTEGGYLISVVWDSKEHSERFMNGTLLPALPVEGGFAGAPATSLPCAAEQEDRPGRAGARRRWSRSWRFARPRLLHYRLTISAAAVSG